jgi:hypothetical protein
MIITGQMVDAFIDAIPESAYDPCPCGCGKKLKFIIPEAEKHEQTFYAKLCATLSTLEK